MILLCIFAQAYITMAWLQIREEINHDRFYVTDFF